MKKSKLLSVPLALGSVASAFGGLYFYSNFVRRTKKPELRPQAAPFFDRIEQLSAEQIWSLTSFDGLALKAHYYPGTADSHVYALLVHGYHGSGHDMLPQAVHFLEKGYHVVMPDLRGHGLSDGDYVGFGYHDHLDILCWIDQIRDFDPEASIFLLGLSMGAATVMMTSGEFLPSQVKCIIEDCGYSNAYEQCRHNMKTLYHLPAFPILTVTNLVLKLKHHYTLRDASPIDYVSHAMVPMLFIHGDQDDFVPFSMQQPLYEACSSAEKEMLIVPDAKHAQSETVNPDLYWSTVDAFLNKHL